MRVLVDGVIYSLQARGGVSRVYTETLPRIAAARPDWRLDLGVCAGLRGEPPTIPGGVRMRIEPERPGSGFFRTLLAAAMLKRFIGLGRNAGALWHSTYHRPAPDYFKGPSVAFFHDCIHERFPDQYRGRAADALRAAKRAQAKSSARILCNSAVTAEDVERFFRVPAERLHIAPLAADPLFRPLGWDEAAKDRAAVGVGASRPFFLFIGNRGGYKNFSLVLAAWRKVQAALGAQLVVVGGKPFTDDEQAQIRATPGERPVLKLDGVADQTLCALYNASAGLLYPSLYEGFGIPLLEAAACGTPVVASDIPSTREVLGDLAHWFAAEDGEGLVEALTAALSPRPGLREALGARAAEFSWEKTAQAMIGAFESAQSD